MDKIHNTICVLLCYMFNMSNASLCNHLNMCVEPLPQVGGGGGGKMLCYVYKHRWALTSISMSAIFDIDICYSDIGDKYVGLINVILLSEMFRYRHQSSFRYPTLKKKKYYSLWIWTRAPRICMRALNYISYCDWLFRLGCRIFDIG